MPISIDKDGDSGITDNAWPCRTGRHGEDKKKKSECAIMIDEKINKQGDLQRRMLEAAEE